MMRFLIEAGTVVMAYGAACWILTVCDRTYLKRVQRRQECAQMRAQLMSMCDQIARNREGSD